MGFLMPSCSSAGGPSGAASSSHCASDAGFPVDVHGAVLVVDGCSVGGPQHLGMTWIRFTPGIVGWWMLVLSPTSHGIIYGKFMDLSADPGRQQGGARQGREVVNTKNIHNNNSSNSNPPTPADARGSALGNNTFDPGFGLVPLLYSIG